MSRLFAFQILALSLLCACSGGVLIPDEKPPEPRRPIDIGVGYGFSCALMNDGTTWCWGLNADGALGAGIDVERQAAPVQTAAPPEATALEVGEAGACVITLSEDVWCWGGADPVDPHPIGDIDVPCEVQISFEHSCVLQCDAVMKCWDTLGGEDAKTLSDGIVQMESTPRHICGRKGDGTLVCAGDVVDAPPSGRPITALNADMGPMCAELADDTLCWNDQAATWISVQETPPAPGVRSYEGTEFWCRTNASQGVECWGANRMGATGLPHDSSPVPVDAPNAIPVSDVTVLGAGTTSFACVLDAGQRVHCWGTQWQGQLGDHVALWNVAPFRIPHAHPWARLWSSPLGLCAVDETGEAWCWGHRPGRSEDGLAAVPERAPHLDKAEHAILNAEYECGLSSGQLRCVGADGSYVLAADDVTSLHHDKNVICLDTAANQAGCVEWKKGAFVAIKTITWSGMPSPLTEVENKEYLCQISEGQVGCQFDDDQRLARPGADFPNGWAPVDVPNVPLSAELAGTWASTCARTLEGEIWCWGYAAEGGLGNGVKPYNHTPVEVTFPAD